MKRKISLQPARRIAVLLVALLATAIGALTVDFDSTSSSSSYSWSLLGIGNDVEMSLAVNNRISEDLVMTVRSGTVFEPSGSTVQRMLIRTNVVFRVPAGQSCTQALAVLCMDISKDPPSPADCSWKVSRDEDMVSFLNFTGELAGELVKELASRPDGISVEKDQLQHQIERYSVWRYKGASQEDIGKFLRDYGKEADAEKESAMLTQMADLVIQMYRQR